VVNNGIAKEEKQNLRPYAEFQIKVSAQRKSRQRLTLTAFFKAEGTRYVVQFARISFRTKLLDRKSLIQWQISDRGLRWVFPVLSRFQALAKVQI